MSQNRLLLLYEKPQCPQREYNGKGTVPKSELYWCLDSAEFGCDHGDKLRATFALDCYDKEAIKITASKGGCGSRQVQDVMLCAAKKRFGNQLAEN